MHWSLNMRSRDSGSSSRTAWTRSGARRGWPWGTGAHAEGSCAHGCCRPRLC